MSVGRLLVSWQHLLHDHQGLLFTLAVVDPSGGHLTVESAAVSTRFMTWTDSSQLVAVAGFPRDNQRIMLKAALAAMK